MHTRAVVCAAVAAFLGNAAAAAPVRPPERYDHAHPALVIVEQDYYKVDPFCRSMFPRSKFPAATDTHRVLGCADIGDGVGPCRIFVPRSGEGRISIEARADIVRHERAHCNGWPADHPR